MSATFAHRTKPASTWVDFAAPTVLIKVGKPSTTFFVNGELLSSTSDFFKTALKQEWREGKRRVVELPDDSTKAFNVYVNWLHSKTIFLGYNIGQDPVEQSNFDDVIEAYALGDKLMDVDFKDAVTDAMFVSTNTLSSQLQTVVVPNATTLNTLYEKTTSACTLRRLVVHRMARMSNPKEIINETSCGAFLAELACEAIAKSSETTMAAAARCEFHEHATGIANCYRRKYA